MKKVIYTAVMLLIAVACSFDDMRLQSPEELGTEMDEYIIEAEGGTAEVNVYANSAVEATLAGNVSWAQIGNALLHGDGTVAVTVQKNSGRARMATLILSTDVRTDTVQIKQKGVSEEYIQIKASAVSTGAGSASVNVPVSTNIDPQFITFDTEYAGDTDSWIGKVSIMESCIIIPCEENTSKGMRQAVVIVRHDNGWGESATLRIRVTQSGTESSSEMNLDFSRLKAKAGQYPIEIGEAYIIEGHIISDIESGNVGENIQTTSTTINYSGCRKTAYFQAKEGGSGFMLEFKTEDDNIVTCNSSVSLCLKGATLARYSNPVRYSITGLEASSVLSCTETAQEEIVVKKCRISDLTDSDIYTKVTVTDCEFPIRKGSLTPVHEGYTSVTERHRITKFATVIRDIEGNHMYIYTNTTCPYRRDGAGLKYGRGEITGVLVHEKYRRFIDGESADEDECGNIGKYQLRHMSADDFDFSDEESFSDFICEWRYIKSINPDGSWSASLGEGTMTHSTAPDTRFLSTGMTASANDYSYLGPVYSNGNHANENGFGIAEIDGIPAVKKEMIGKGSFSAASANSSKTALSWRNNKWYADKVFQYWLVSFSTRDISTDVLSMQLSVLNTSGGKCPNEWKAEWAESKDAETWMHIADYNVPDIVRDAITESWQSPGYKPVDIRLPSEMLGKEKVYIRLTPRSRKGSSVVYLDSDFSNGSYSAMNYFAIRYNK